MMLETAVTTPLLVGTYTVDQPVITIFLKCGLIVGAMCNSDGGKKHVWMNSQCL